MNGTAPGFVRVRIDGAGHDMHLPAARPGTRGVVYDYSTKLDVGVHEIVFEADDGLGGADQQRAGKVRIGARITPAPTTQPPPDPTPDPTAKPEPTPDPTHEPTPVPTPGRTPHPTPTPIDAQRQRQRRRHRAAEAQPAGTSPGAMAPATVAARRLEVRLPTSRPPAVRPPAEELRLAIRPALPAAAAAPDQTAAAAPDQTAAVVVGANSRRPSSPSASVPTHRSCR